MSSPPSKTGAAALSVASNSALILLKAIAGTVTGSVALLTEALHSATDLIASIVALFSVRAADVPADESHPYGHEKIEDMAAAIEGVLILVGSVVIAFEAVRHLIEGRGVERLGIGIAVLALSIVVNFFVSRTLSRRAQATGSPALAADAAHLSTDMLSSGGVLAALVVVAVTGWDWLDPVVALVVAAVVAVAGIRILTRSSRVLVDETLPTPSSTPSASSSRTSASAASSASTSCAAARPARGATSTCTCSSARARASRTPTAPRTSSRTPSASGSDRPTCSSTSSPRTACAPARRSPRATGPPDHLEQVDRRRRAHDEADRRVALIAGQQQDDAGDQAREDGHEPGDPGDAHRGLSFQLAMTARAALTPAGALGWLGSLSVDVRAAAVLDAEGAVLAGDPALAAAQEGGDVMVARSERHSIVVRTGPRPLKRLLRADLRAAVEALEIA